MSGVLDPPPRARLEELGGTSGQGSPAGLPAPAAGEGSRGGAVARSGPGWERRGLPREACPGEPHCRAEAARGRMGRGPQPGVRPEPRPDLAAGCGRAADFPAPHPTPLVRFVEGRETAAGIGAGACGPFPRFVPSRLSDLGPGGRAGAGRPVGAVVSPGDPRKWLACRRRGECSALESVVAGVLPLGSVAGPAKGTQLGLPGAPEAVPSAGRSRLAAPMTTACPRRPRGGGDGAFPFWNCFSSFHFPRIFLCSTLSM